MKPSKPTLKAYYPGLNVFRALAVLMMILAHAARIQTNMGTLHNNPSHAGLFDWPFVAMLLIEPIISATFLFIAGFSLVLSIAKGKTQAAWQRQSWLTNLGKKMLVLYLISVIFYVADQGLQTPDFLVSSGVLAIIAVGLFLSGLLLVLPKPTVALIIALLCTLLCAYFLEQQKWNIVGLNAGAGGIVTAAASGPSKSKVSPAPALSHALTPALRAFAECQLGCPLEVKAGPSGVSIKSRGSPLSMPRTNLTKS